MILIFTKIGQELDLFEVFQGLRQYE